MFHDPIEQAIDRARVLPIVVGAHLDAERTDRATAYRLRTAMIETLGTLGAGEWEPVVLTDLWHLHSDWLGKRPTVSVGAPVLNALSASLADRIESVFVIDGRLMVQMDLDSSPAVACCWGVGPAETAEAAAVFAERHMGAFVRAALRSEALAGRR
jgi:hypothetical protein